MSANTPASGGPSGGIKQLLGSLLITIMSIGMVLGGFLMSQMDTGPIPATPTEAVAGSLPSPTPFLPTFTPRPQDTPSLTPTTERVPPTEIPSPTPPSALIPRCEAPAGWRAYTVRAAETLNSLAWRSHTTVFALMQANCLSTANVQSGQRIYLPPTYYVTPTPQPRCGPPAHWVVYRVQAGDTLYSLARYSGTSIESVRLANCLKTYTIYTGQALYLPRRPLKPTSPPPPTATAVPSLTPTPPTTPTMTLTPGPSVTPPSATPTTPVTTTVTPTASNTPTPTQPGTETSTPTPEPTATATPTSTPEQTATATATSQSPTATATSVPPSPTATPEDPTPTS